MNRDKMIEALAKAIYCHNGRLPAPWDADLLDDAYWMILRKEAENQAVAVLDLCGPEKLVWEVFRGGTGAKAKAWNKASYLVNRWSDGKFDLVDSYPGYQGDNISGCFHPTLEAAQAAAQAHADAAHWANTPIGKLVGV